MTIRPLATPDAMRASLRRLRHPKGRPPDDQAQAEVAALLGEAPPEGWPHDRLIEHLHLLNDHFGVLFEPHLVALARAMRLPVAAVYEVASFYHHFQIQAEGTEAPRWVLRVCDSLACAMAGSAELLSALPERLRALGLGDVRVEPAPCVGRCEQAPVAVLHQRPVPRATVEAVCALAQALPTRDAARHPPSPSVQEVVPNQLPGQGIPAEHALVFDAAAQAPCRLTDGSEPLSPPVVDLAAYRAGGGYALAAALASGAQDPEAVIVALEQSGLRGLGGAGFPAGRKWRAVRAQAAEHGGQPLLAVNIDEGEPGTFKDRTYLERDPHRFLEGVLVAAQVVGCAAVYLYLRDEYHGARAVLQAAIDALQADPPCPLPPITLRRGAGAYICGEESAMVESLEGRRGEPRLRPPYLAQVGLFGRPTLAHNFETLYWVRDIVVRGPAWFAGFGRRGRQGLRSFSVSGRVQSPGVKLAPAGISVRELVDEFCGGMQAGHQLYAYLPGGASGGILPASLADLPLDFDTLQPHGCFIGSAAVVVLSQQDRARDAALNVMRFFAHESCGQCTPCRVGTDKAVQLMQAPVWDEATLGDLAQVMGDASICGLGQAAPNPIRCVLRYFPHEVGLAPAAPALSTPHA